MSPRPVFIGGCQRSGTTFLGSLLGGSPDAVTVPESHFRFAWPRTVARGGDRNDVWQSVKQNRSFRHWTSHRDTEVSTPKDDFSSTITELVVDYARQRGILAPRVWIDHTPQNSQYGFAIAKQFPDARFIHLVRDGRAVAASIMPLTWGPNTIPAAAQYWALRMAQGLAMEACSLADRVIRIRFEDLLSAPEPTLRRICRFCDLEFSTDMLEGGQFDVPTTTLHQHRLVGQPPEARRATAWQSQLTDREVEIFESIVGELLEYLGYEPRFGIAAHPAKRDEIVRLAAQDWFHRRIGNSFKKRRMRANPNS